MGLAFDSYWILACSEQLSSKVWFLSLRCLGGTTLTVTRKLSCNLEKKYYIWLCR